MPWTHSLMERAVPTLNFEASIWTLKLALGNVKGVAFQVVESKILGQLDPLREPMPADYEAAPSASCLI